MYLIRQEKETDYKEVEKLVEEAFKDITYSDHKEHLLVKRLRKSDAFIDQLSLLAEGDGNILGHIMFTRIVIKNEKNEHQSLALAPVSVLPAYQGQGLGSSLIKEGLELAKNLGFKSVVVLGDNKYYSRFGFKPASKWGIRAPFEVVDEYFMALELGYGELEGVEGTVVYSREFLE